MQWWQDLLRRFEFENKFPPSKLRHIFVDERLGLDSVEGPNNKATARIMGNCVGERASPAAAASQCHCGVW